MITGYKLTVVLDLDTAKMIDALAEQHSTKKSIVVRAALQVAFEHLNEVEKRIEELKEKKSKSGRPPKLAVDGG